METDGGTGQEKCSMNGPRRGRYGNGGGGGRYLRRARTPGFGTAQTKRKSEGKPFLKNALKGPHLLGFNGFLLGFT